MKNIIFVCHGSICRSPAAEMIARDYIKKNSLEDLFNVTSLAVSNEEIGNDIYPPMRRELLSKGIKLYPHCARKITQSDYEKADYIFYMDDSNLFYLNRLLDDHKNTIMPIYKFTPSISHIEDPWYSDRYDLVVSQIRLCIENIFFNLLK